jgi:hypothetical protein
MIKKMFLIAAIAMVPAYANANDSSSNGTFKVLEKNFNENKRDADAYPNVNVGIFEDCRSQKKIKEYNYGIYEGKGKYVYINGDVYEGDYKNGKKEGKGKYVFVNGNVYEGDWKNGVMEGKGKMVYINGNVYEGDWKNNVEKERVNLYSQMETYMKGIGRMMKQRGKVSM